ncbi:MAG: hypothetical protein K8823_303 [Cenarchaeum symbiont of Oopsacas minuta]|nr:hypothetical protein [Cenarchaeum symbiont of Oopsacas minuta]
MSTICHAYTLTIITNIPSAVHDGILVSKSSIIWRDDVLGVAYRYYDLRMNVVPLYNDMNKVTDLWNNTCNWWVEHSIRVRFIESGEKYWFAIGAESTRPDNNIFLCKELEISKNYERFKKGHDGEAYFRLGAYEKKYFKDSKDDAVCNCGHEQIDHDEDEYSCLYEDCKCKKFVSFQVRLHKRKKTVTDIKFLQEDKAKDDPLAWNCLHSKKYSSSKDI